MAKLDAISVIHGHMSETIMRDRMTVDIPPII